MHPHPLAMPDVLVLRGETRRFQSCTALAAAVATVSIATAVASAWAVLALLDGYGVSPVDIMLTLPVPLTIMVVVFAVQVWQSVRRPSWIRLSTTGIELAQGGDPVLITWPQIADIRIRRRGVFAVLQVVPASLAAVMTINDAHDLPQVHYDTTTAGLRIEVGLMRPGPAALRAALTLYRPATPARSQ